MQIKIEPHLLVIILGDLITYKNKIINIKIGLIIIDIKGKTVIIIFNILLLGSNKAVLEMPWLKEYNLKINWVIGSVKI